MRELKRRNKNQLTSVGTGVKVTILGNGHMGFQVTSQRNLNHTGDGFDLAKEIRHFGID